MAFTESLNCPNLMVLKWNTHDDYLGFPLSHATLACLLLMKATMMKQLLSPALIPSLTFHLEICVFSFSVFYAMCIPRYLCG